MEFNQLAVAGLVAVGAGAAAYALIYPYLSGEVRAEKRQKALSGGAAVSQDRLRGVVNRRDQVASTLKDIEAKAAAKNRLRLEERLAQAGLDWTKKKFFTISAVTAAVAAVLVLAMTGKLFYAAVGGFVGFFGLPRWYVGLVMKKRMKRFVEEFPNAVDVIVRGVKAGLPLNDCVRIVANESAEPVRGEFRHIMEQQTLGISIPDACANMFKRVPLSEANFFGIVITIQAKTGGSLAEALANLSKVLRERKKMKMKITAMSTEAKASAGIIGALPFVVAGLVYLTSPNYIVFLWTTETGKIALVASGFWMACGVTVMRKMINFDF